MDAAARQALQLQLPNPFTPMAFLPPELAYQVMVSNYTVVGALAVMIWDVMINTPNDWKLLTKYRITAPTIIYFISRWTTLAYLVGMGILLTAPVGSSCFKFHYINILFTISISSTTLLFVLRVQAIHQHNRCVMAISSFLWSCVLGACTTTVFGLAGETIGITKYCTQSKLEPYVSAAAIVPLVNDTFVFLATTWKLLQNAQGDKGMKANIQTLLLGRNLPLLSRALLQDGQVYYLTTISLNLATPVLFFNTSIPITYRSLIGVPNVVLMNCMACHVFRNVKLGIFTQGTVERIVSLDPLRFRHTTVGFASFDDRAGDTTRIKASRSPGIIDSIVNDSEVTVIEVKPYSTCPSVV